MQPPVQESVKAPVAAEKQKRKSKKDGAKTAPLDQVTEEPKEPVKETPRADAEPNDLQDSEVMVRIYSKPTNHRAHCPGTPYRTSSGPLGYAMLNVDSILAKLKTAGEIIEPREGVFRAV